LTLRTGGNIALLNVSLHAGPIVIIMQPKVCLVDTEVAKGVMHKTEEEFTDSWDARNDKAIGNIEKPICTRRASNAVDVGK